MKWWAICTNLPVYVIVRLPHPRSRDSQDQERSLGPSAEKETRNYDIECSNHHPSLSTQTPKGLSRSKMKWWVIYPNLPVYVIVRLPHPRTRDSQDREMFLAPCADKQICNCEIDFSNHHPSLSSLRPKGLSRSKMKSWVICTNLTVYVIVRVPHPPNRDSQRQETFLAPSADKQKRNCDIEYSNHHPSLSTLRPKGLSRSRMKWWLICTSLPVYVILRLPHPRSRDSQGQETFLRASADNQKRNYDIECSNHHPSLWPQRPKRLSRSKMKWWAIYTNLPV